MKCYWLIVFLVSFGVGPAIADDCPSLLSAECGGGEALFGLRWDGAMVSQGQTVLLPCNANLLRVEFKFVNDGQSGGSVPPMITGDPIFVTVLDLDMNEYGTAMSPMPFDVGNDWIMFEFDNLELEAGLYLFAAWTDVPRQCGVHFCPDQDPYPHGERYGSMDGLAGPWFAWYGTDDVPFRVYLETGPVSTEIDIDVMPGNPQNPINCKGNPGVVPVAILTTDTFDALSVDHETVRFGPGEAAEFHVFKRPGLRGNGEALSGQMVGAPKRHEEDVDDDGDIDLVFHFAREETGIRCGDAEAVLNGQTFDGQTIIGRDAIRTVPDGDVEPEPDAELQISPNPFNPSTRISFTMRTPEHVRIGVYDLRGRLVSELANEPYPVGRHTLEWQGRDMAGQAVPSGMYFFRIDLGGQVEVRKAMLMK